LTLAASQAPLFRRPTVGAVVVSSQWVKDDILEHYRVPPAKIQVIPWASPNAPFAQPATGQLAEVRERYALTEPFCLYPAVTWPHKNHLRLVEAVALLRDEHDLQINLVCTGALTDFYHQRIRPVIEALKLEEQVRFLGHIPGEDLRALYRLAQFVVIPTLFEAASSMIFEAWQEGIAITCSNATSLPEQAADSALLFDPYSVAAIAGAVRQMADDANLRERLLQRGYQRQQDFSWARTARAYRAVYRRVAGLPLDDVDRELLEVDWMRNPDRAGLAR
jgi:glycosyltransferase involved in cell wall biosynthesis